MSIYKLFYYFKLLLAYVFSLISFPLQCISCGSHSYGVALCTKCKDELYNSLVPHENRCISCGVTLISEDSICLNCRNIEDDISKEDNKRSFGLKDFKSIYPIHQYTLWKKELLFAWKIANNRSLTPVFANLVYAVYVKYYNGIPIVPVPPRKNKIKERGWDQIDDLCEHLNKLYGVPVVKCLMRLNTNEQKKQNRQERLENIDKNYCFNEKVKTVPQEVLIIDDIMTTGATLESCAYALKNAGALHIHAVTLFYV